MTSMQTLCKPKVFCQENDPHTSWLVAIALVLLLITSCTTIRKEDDQASKVRVVHLTRPDNQAAAAEDIPINNPSSDGNVITGTADLGEKPLAHIESPDGYAPDSPGLLNNTDTTNDTAATQQADTPDQQQVIVREGDTVYSIATSHGLSVEELATANQLDENYAIVPGQILTLAIGDVPGPAAANEAESGVSDTTAEARTEETPPPQAKAESPTDITTLPGKQTSGLTWSWPLQGEIKLLKNFRDNGANKGVDLQGEEGDPVYATSDGTIVYSGNELKGYGNLIIISHKGDYMSAYAHNSKLLVEADQQVKRGQKIAEVGSEESNQVKLFFQVRHKGEPVDPMPLLPQP